MADKKAFLKGIVRKAGKGIMKGANKVTDAVGARDLSNYAAGKMAKAMVSKDAKKYVKDDTSGKAALKSAGKLGLSIASVASVAGAARGVAARAAAKKAGKTTTNRILAAHKAGGDTKMLKALKDSNPKVGRKLGVKSSSLDDATGTLEPGIKNYKHVFPDKIRMQEKRKIIRRKMDLNRSLSTRQKELSKRAKGDAKTSEKQYRRFHEKMMDAIDDTGW